ncbi:MAG: branched-subunit amino acid aminotransferase/4-amino-4-deoxychorismate lyase [Crocinitomix sp.]|jgi:branched-subunit amino acid aminotransferase/4-amino-4-deoxychorismate lyase
MSNYVINNGVLVSTDGYSIRAGNRGHLYGDGLFETIRVINGHPINLENHLNRLIEGMKVMQLNYPVEFNEPFFEREIQTLLTKNEISESARVRLSVDRKAGGNYLPTSNHIDYLIEVERVTPNRFVLNEQGLALDLYDQMNKQINFLSPYKTKNCLLYIMGKLKAKEKGVDDLLILNDKMGIIESTSSNLFIVSNGVLYTPGLDLGCLGGTMRMQIINLAIQHNIKVYECNISPQNLLAADELFLTNAIKGIVWGKTFRTKEYGNTISQKLVDYLNIKWNASE